MGASSSVQQRLDFKGCDVYSHWDAVHLRQALERLRSIIHNNSHHDQAVARAGERKVFLVNKRIFWEVFTDFTCTLEDGSFLCLPVEHFDDIFDKDRRRFVDIVQVFATAALWASGSLKERFAVLFDLVTTVHNSAQGDGETKSQTMTTDDMLVLVRSILFACFHIGLIFTTPSLDDVREIVDDIYEVCGVARGAGLTLEAFLDVAKAHYRSRELLRRFHLKQDVDSSGSEEAGAMPLTRKATRHSSMQSMGSRRSSSMFPDDPVLSSMLTVDVVEDGGATFDSDSDDEGAARRRSHSPSALHATSSLLSSYTREVVAHNNQEDAMVDFSSLSNIHNRTRAHKQKLIAGRRVMQDLVTKVHFSMHELQQLARMFSDLSDATGHISKDMFRSVLQRQVPGLRKDAMLLERIYAVSDLDNDGRVDFREFTLGVSRLLRGDTGEKLRMLFSLYDVNKDGKIEIGELIHLIKQKHDDLQALVDFAGELVSSLDTNNDNRVSRAEFSDALRRDQVVRETFLSLVLVQFGMRASIKRLQAKVPQFTFAAYRTVVDKLRKSPSVLTKLASLRDFWKLFHTEFGIPEDCEEVMAQIFEHFDLKQHGGHVAVRDALNGIGQILAPSEQEFEDLVFDLYDLDGDGTLTKNEILHMLLSASQNTHESARRVIEALAHLDKDGDGQISIREFRAHATSMPSLMEALHIVLGVTAGRELPKMPSPSHARPGRKSSASKGLHHADSKASDVGDESAASAAGVAGYGEVTVRGSVHEEPQDCTPRQSDDERDASGVEPSSEGQEGGDSDGDEDEEDGLLSGSLARSHNPRRTRSFQYHPRRHHTSSQLPPRKTTSFSVSKRSHNYKRGRRLRLKPQGLQPLPVHHQRPPQPQPSSRYSSSGRHSHRQPAARAGVSLQPLAQRPCVVQKEEKAAAVPRSHRPRLQPVAAGQHSSSFTSTLGSFGSRKPHRPHAPPSQVAPGHSPRSRHFRRERSYKGKGDAVKPRLAPLKQSSVRRGEPTQPRRRGGSRWA